MLLQFCQNPEKILLILKTMSNQNNSLYGPRIYKENEPGYAKPFSVHGHIWFNKGQECFLGPGKIELLNGILKEGSIHAASKNIGLSYQHAWKTIDKLNKLAPLPVIVPQRGGKDGGGALITDYGIKLFNDLNGIDMRFTEFLLNINKNLDLCF
jgi:molybdate transport system regulatory protein